MPAPSVRIRSRSISVIRNIDLPASVRKPRMKARQRIRLPEQDQPEREENRGCNEHGPEDLPPYPALLLFFFWEILAPVMIVALFFGIRYSFEGEEEAEKANSILNKAGDFAQDVRSEFTKNDSDTGEM